MAHRSRMRCKLPSTNHHIACIAAAWLPRPVSLRRSCQQLRRIDPWPLDPAPVQHHAHRRYKVPLKHWTSLNKIFPWIRKPVSSHGSQGGQMG